MQYLTELLIFVILGIYMNNERIFKKLGVVDIMAFWKGEEKKEGLNI